MAGDVNNSQPMALPSMCNIDCNWFVVAGDVNNSQPMALPSMCNIDCNWFVVAGDVNNSQPMALPSLPSLPMDYSLHKFLLELEKDITDEDLEGLKFLMSGELVSDDEEFTSL